MSIPALSTVPFNRAVPVGRETEYVAEAVRAGALCGDGPFTKRCQRLLEAELGVERALLTTSCTDALEMSALLLELEPGDEVIFPSFTFVSTVNAFVLRRVRPVFADIRADTLNIDERRIAPLLSPRTRGIVVVHYAGVGCEMGALMEIAARHGLFLVEDNAHGLFGKYRGRQLGTLGCMGTLSFHQTKNFSCGEGGALLLNDRTLCERAEIVREKGTNRAKFIRGEVDKYSWVDLGSSYLPSDILAAFLYGQLECRAAIQQRRREVWDAYYTGLGTWASANGVRLPIVPAECVQAYHIFYMLLPDPVNRQRFLDHLRAMRVMASSHYLPLHLSAMGRKFGGERASCEVTVEVSERLVRLPLYNTLSRGEVDRVLEAVACYQCV